MKFEIGPTGNLIKGHVYDVNVASFKDALYQFDPDLYLTWNSKKRRGLGCWEIRCRPQKLWVLQGAHAGMNIYAPERIENDMVHHVKDMPFLSYSFFEDVVDTRDHKNWVRDYERKEQAYIAKKTAEMQSDLQYGLKQDRSVYKVFQEMVARGVNPNLLAKFWGQNPT